jgi:hypothetical protein
MAGYELVAAKSGSRLAKAAPPSASGQSFGKGPAIVDHYFQILSFDLEGLSGSLAAGLGAHWTSACTRFCDSVRIGRGAQTRNV